MGPARRRCGRTRGGTSRPGGQRERESQIQRPLPTSTLRLSEATPPFLSIVSSARIPHDLNDGGLKSLTSCLFPGGAAQSSVSGCPFFFFLPLLHDYLRLSVLERPFLPNRSKRRIHRASSPAGQVTNPTSVLKDAWNRVGFLALPVATAGPGASDRS